MKSKQRKAIESRYIGKCTIKIKGKVTDPITNISKNGEIDLIENEPCRLSYKTVPTMNNNESADTVKQIIKLFIRPELDIPAGSKIIVTQHGRTNIYRNSGFPEIHTSHQEVVLELEDKFGRLNE